MTDHIPPQQELEINLCNEISASIYGLYFYELPKNSPEREVVYKVMTKVKPALAQRDQQRLSKIKEVFDEFEQSGPPWASRSAKIQYEGFRDYFLPALTAALGPDNSKTKEN